MYSYSALSCVANPVCTNVNVSVPHSVYNSQKVFVPIESFNGDPANGMFLFESGYLGQGGQGVLFETNDGHASRISTARYMLYGTVEARLRHDTEKGLIHTFGTLSDIGDSIAWQFSGANTSSVSAKYFAMNNETNSVGTTLNLGSNFSITDYHTYGLRWNQSGITWTLDGANVHSVSRKEAGAQFPRSPSRVLFTTWGAVSDTPSQLRKWAGGALSYNSSQYLTTGYFAQELTHLTVSCANLTMSNVTITGGGSTPTSYIYTGKNSSVSSEPEFLLSRDQISLIANPGQDGPDDLPGSPNLAANGPNTNMYAGGTRNTNYTASSSSTSGQASSTASPHHTGLSPTAKKLAIGIPAGVGGALLLGTLGLLAIGCMRRKRRHTDTKPMSEQNGVRPMGIYSPGQRPYQGGSYAASMPSTSGAAPIAPFNSRTTGTNAHSANSNLPYVADPSVSQPASTMIAMPQSDDTSYDDMRSHEHASNGSYMYGVEDQPNSRHKASRGDQVYDSSHSWDDSLDSDDRSSQDSSVSDVGARSRRHYVNRHSRSLHSRFTREQNEELAAHDEWYSLHHAALGSDEDNYFNARTPPSQHSSSGRRRSHYTRHNEIDPNALPHTRPDDYLDPPSTKNRMHTRRRSQYGL
ncbi:hypothetical protein MPSI1_003964 [Malassezia psittaci]|uniref:GH16 domain-containing protein n=1 Tax=Malassezia psittaci TaxID=1821823 RepID=A0AAF0JFP3_9BASI|nr:hypothetical protein MPSI1_003964 [Malassezia psittaci]